MSDVRQTILLELSYNGEAFHGLAPQRGLRTVAGELARVLEACFGEPARGLTFAARTDAGVSANQNFATAWFDNRKDRSALLSALATFEVPDLSIRQAQRVERSVNARTCARAKHYRYRVACAGSVAPRAWTLAENLDVPRMQQAAHRLVGVHDFSAFRASNCGSKNPIKELTRLDVTRVDDLVTLDVQGNSFLRRMVRILSGTLIEVGLGQRSPEDVAHVLATQQRGTAGVTAPAHGLELVEVTLDYSSSRAK